MSNIDVRKGDLRQSPDFYMAEECVPLLTEGVVKIVFQMRF